MNWTSLPKQKSLFHTPQSKTSNPKASFRKQNPKFKNETNDWNVKDVC